MRVLVACEFSGIVRRAFALAGHDAWSCDLAASENESPFHWKGDVLELLEQTATDPEFWPPFDLLIAHPPCTYLSVSGLHWNHRRPERQAKTVAASEFFMALANAPVPRICIENPVGIMSSRWRPPDQYIQPYEFGHDASKKTGLWLKGLPQLGATQRIAPRMAHGRPRWSNQTDSGQNRLGPSPTRAMDRARTYPGIAKAMAEQWGVAA